MIIKYERNIYILPNRLVLSLLIKVEFEYKKVESNN